MIDEWGNSMNMIENLILVFVEILLGWFVC